MRFDARTRIRPIAAAILAGTAAVALIPADAGEGAYSKQIDYRTGVMDVFVWNLKPIAAMVKGKRPFDQSAAQDYAKDLALATQLNLLPGFPEGSTDEDSAAKAEIWKNWQGFEEKYQNLRQQAARLAETVATGNRDSIKVQLGATAKACKSCHKEYREK